MADWGKANYLYFNFWNDLLKKENYQEIPQEVSDKKGVELNKVVLLALLFEMNPRTRNIVSFSFLLQS